MEEKSLSQRDHAVIWHPYTQMQTAGLPIGILKGEGVYLIADDGTKYLDAVSSWWVNIHGHAHPYIAEKVAEQLRTLEHVIFAGFTHPSAVILAERLLNIIPKNQQKVFYSDNGSTAVEVALKMALQFWQNKDENRLKILAFNNSYHGDTFGAMSVSSRSAFTEPFEKLLFEVEFIDVPAKRNLEQLKAKITSVKNDLAAFIYEPLIQGAGGMQMYDAAEMDELISHCRNEGVLLIADEVMTGFGRSGKLFASEYMAIKPDMMCFSKGITGGTMALGVTTCTIGIFNAFLSDDKLKTLFHGHSFTANPVACSASIASMDILERPETMENIKRIERKHQQFAEKIKHHSKLKNIRQTGTIIALEWKTGEGTSYFNELGANLYKFFISRQIILRPLGNIIYILPPYCITNAELDYIYANIEEALDQF